MMRVTNEELEKSADTSAKWIEDNLGIKERRITYGYTSTLAYIAAQKAIADAGLKPEDLSPERSALARSLGAVT